MTRYQSENRRVYHCNNLDVFREQYLGAYAWLPRIGPVFFAGSAGKNNAATTASQLQLPFGQSSTEDDIDPTKKRRKTVKEHAQHIQEINDDLEERRQRWGVT